MLKQKKFLYALIPLLSLLILFLRKPEVFTQAQFWAEDGRVWFANAYNFGGLRALFLSQDGYFQTISRLVAAFSLNFPLHRAPLVFNLAAIFIQVLPVWFLFSERFKKLIPNFWVKILLALLFLLLPNSSEIHGNLTNSQWFLALLAFMVIIAEPAEDNFWKTFDFAGLALSALSGPFCLFLAPVAFLKFLLEKQKYNLYKFVVLVGGCLLQLYSLLVISSGGRGEVAQYFSIGKAVKLFGSQVILGGLMGYGGNSWIVKNIVDANSLYVIAAVIGTAVLIYVLIKAPNFLRLFTGFALLMLAAGLLAPTPGVYTITDFKALVIAMNGVRYWFVPMLAFLAALTWGISQKQSKLFTVISGILLALSTVGIFLDFRHPAFVDYRFYSYSQNFEQLPAGQSYRIPINPPGWDMILIKK